MGVIAHGIPQSPALDVPVDRPEAVVGSGASEPVGAGAPAGAAGAVYDLDRLERAISALVEENGRLRGESAGLRRALAEKGERVLALEGQLLEANQRRRDVIKRVDELIAQMDALDAQLEQTESDVS